MIIVEGLDNAGKSTLINQLNECFKLPYAHAHRSMAETEHSILRWQNWAAACPKTLILDRHPAISDLVYGPIIRGRTAASLQLAQGARRNNFLIFCCPSLDTIKATFEDREQMEGTHARLLQLYEAYQDLMLELEPDYIYDFTNPRAYPALVRNLQSAIRRM